MIEFGYGLAINQFVVSLLHLTTWQTGTYKTIHMYYLKKSHDSLNSSCD